MVEWKYSGSAPAVKHTWKYVRSNFLTVLTILGVVFGIVFGVVLKNTKDDEWSQREQVYVKFGGELFLRMLRALSLPLILSSVIAALGSLDLRHAGKVGMRTGLFYFLTTVCAVILGVILVIAIHPGAPNPDKELEQPGQLQPRKVLNSDVMMDLIRNMFPSNLVQATMYEYQTILDIPTLDEIKEKLGKGEETDFSKMSTKSRYIEGTNFLGLLVFSTAVGIALASMGQLGKPVVQLVRIFSQIFMLISTWIIWLSPIGVFCLLAGSILEVKNFAEAWVQTSMYVFTVLLGFALHGFVVLPLIYYVISGSQPFKVIGNALQALVTAFGTSSSSATLPVTIACVEDKHGVDPKIARFVLPVGASINMDGTALYEAVAAIFLVQLHDIPLDISTVFAISFIATVSSMGTSGIPHAGIVTMSMLMNVVGLPLESISFLIAVDFLLHRVRTTVNVLGDIMGASLIDKMYKDDLEKTPGDSESTEDLNQSYDI